MRRLSLSVLAGVMLGFAFPPSHFGILACFGLIPLLVVLDGVDRTRAALGYTYVAMLIFHIITLNWTGGYAHMNDPYMMIAGATTMTVHPLFYFAPIGAYHFVRKRAGTLAALLALPFLWVAYEYSHTLSEWSFPWLSLGNTQSYDLSRIQIVSVTGVLGLSFWILWMNVIGYLLVTSFQTKGINFKQKKNVVLIAVLLALYVSPMVYGAFVLQGAPPMAQPISPTTEASNSLITVGMVQSNVDPWEKWTKSGFETINMYLGMTDELVKSNAGHKPDLVLWPETAIPYSILQPRNRLTLDLLRQRLSEIGVPVLSGFPYSFFYEDSTKAPPSAKRIQSTGERWDAYNATGLIQPGVDDVRWYGKMKMVPIAERVPYADAFYYFDFLRWGVGIGGWQIGRDTVVFEEKKTGAKFCSLICYESVYPEFVTEFVKRGAEFITIVTIDSWWDHMSGAYQHHQYAIFRAVENHRWVARCAVGGFSSYIDPFGRVYDKTELFSQTNLNRTIQRITNAQASTFYTRHGDWLAKICVLVSALVLLSVIVRKYSNRKMK
ncbi:MAG: apolipoprotein N-acyltransferase [Ignavibacteriae bacterium]|nr:apolipoprotein N-acyltransferase [Ignavibacteriota bacterium]